MAIMLTTSVFAANTRLRDRLIRPDAIVFEYIEIMKTYDLYRVICDTDQCCQQGKCLGTVDATTCLSLCGLQFDKPNTEYWVEYRIPGADPEWVQVGYCTGQCEVDFCDPVCVCKDSEYGRQISAENQDEAP
jgi:hypothetical protein